MENRRFGNGNNSHFFNNTGLGRRKTSRMVSYRTNLGPSTLPSRKIQSSSYEWGHRKVDLHAGKDMGKDVEAQSSVTEPDQCPQWDVGLEQQQVRRATM